MPPIENDQLDQPFLLLQESAWKEKHLIQTNIWGGGVLLIHLGTTASKERLLNVREQYILITRSAEM